MTDTDAGVAATVTKFASLSLVRSFSWGPITADQAAVTIDIWRNEEGLSALAEKENRTVDSFVRGTIDAVAARDIDEINSEMLELFRRKILVRNNVKALRNALTLAIDKERAERNAPAQLELFS